MMNHIKHHLTDALLMGYAAGTLPEAFNLVVASHLSMCDSCRAALAAFEAVGGAVMTDAEPVEMAESALAATMARLSDTPPRSVPPVPRADGLFPAPLRDYVSGDIDSVKWRRIGGGVSQMVLKTAGGASVRLLRIPAGSALPDHGHRGTELTLVLQGAFVDATDRFTPGDVQVANEDLNHTPVAEQGLDCICLAATDAPLRFTELMPRIAQRFIGI